jgi:hypothetical protein
MTDVFMRVMVVVCVMSQATVRCGRVLMVRMCVIRMRMRNRVSFVIHRFYLLITDHGSARPSVTIV